MARQSHIRRQRAIADANYAALAGPAPLPAPAALPPLLDRAVAIISLHPDVAFWAGGLSSAVGSFRLCRQYYSDPCGMHSHDIDCLVLYNPDIFGASFQVGMRVGDRYKPMTDIAGFVAWLRMQGVTQFS